MIQDNGGWYARDNTFRTLVDIQFVAAMGPPGGGRTFVTNRYLRHFNTLALAQVSVRVAEKSKDRSSELGPISGVVHACAGANPKHLKPKLGC